MISWRCSPEARAPPLCLAEGSLGSPEVLAMLRDLARSVAGEFAPSAWMMVEGSEVVGLCSVVRLDVANRSIDIGYGIAASRRERSIAGRAIAEIVRWARSDPRVDAVTADTSVDYIASQRVLERNGFERVGTRIDPEDGPMICWRVRTSS